MTDPASEDVASDDPANALTTDPKLLELLVCPLTKMPLIYDRAAQKTG